MKLSIIHFAPIELYPPVMNWLDYLVKRGDSHIEIQVYTMKTPIGYTGYESKLPTLKIKRIGEVGNEARLVRYWSYLMFYSGVLINLVKWKPDAVMYYETLSALPAFIYKRYFGSGSRLIIHYHEYITKKEYQQGMFLNKLGHILERKIYRGANWISHTNSDRMKRFKMDNEDIELRNTFILPNYPSQSWISKHKVKIADPVVRFVYIGALSLSTMYTREFAEWIKNQKGKASWDIYTSNITSDAKLFLKSIEDGLIQLHSGVGYFSLPTLLENFNVGVILYKGHIPNYVYNAPNKLFEYWACNLDVWFPIKMKSSLPYANQGSYPRIVPIDFEKLDTISLVDLTNHSELIYQTSKYYCEKEFDFLYRVCLSS